MLGANFNWCWISTVRCYVARLSGARYLMLGANFNRCWISTVRCKVYNIHPVGAPRLLCFILWQFWVWKSRSRRRIRRRIQLWGGRSKLFAQKVPEPPRHQDGHMARVSEKVCSHWALQVLHVAQAEQPLQKWLRTVSNIWVEEERLNCFWTKGVLKRWVPIYWIYVFPLFWTKS